MMVRWNSITLCGFLLIIFCFYAQGEPYIGEVRCMAVDFTPRGFAKADGQLLQISQNEALYSLLGSRYGGNGRTTFALPKLTGLKASGGEKVDCFIAVEGVFPYSI